MDNCPEYKSPIKEVGWDLGSGLAGFAYKRHTHKQLICSLQELVSPGRGSPCSAQMSRHQIQKLGGVVIMKDELYLPPCHFYSEVLVQTSGLSSITLGIINYYNYNGS